jgi:hypothetical protein
VVVRGRLAAQRGQRARGAARAPTTAHSLPSMMQFAPRTAASATRTPYPGATARSVASKSVLATGPTHGEVAPASW